MISRQMAKMFQPKKVMRKFWIENEEWILMNGDEIGKIGWGWSELGKNGQESWFGTSKSKWNPICKFVSDLVNLIYCNNFVLIEIYYLIIY